ncbi:MAG TPA: dynamin family protein, partial [Iamia sp.]|nr:dynamin family protein [Iamia sp.]
MRARLLSPLRVAVAGSVSSGKSTLVNALLGQRIAPVDAGECTRLVTWFRYDHHQRIEVQRRDGGVTTVPFAAGTRIPDDLGVPVDDVARLIVHLSNERLRDLTIIDTPGLNTVTDENQRATADALGLGDATREAGDSRVAMSDADALLFLTPHVRESDVEVLEQFRALFAASGLTAANAVGILSKVDRLAPDGDPWPVARRLAEAAKDRLANVVSDVVPVMGLMAETASTDAFTESDAYALAALAKLDEIDLEDALISPQDLLDAEVPDVSRDQLRRLLSMLDLHGIAVGVELVQGGARGAGELLRGFRQRSGVEPLADVVEHDFARRASALKARGGLADLRRILAQAQGEEAAVAVAMAGPLERVELDPELHDLRILDALRSVEEGAARVPDELRESLKMLALEETPARQLGLDESADPGEMAAAASRAVAAWARYSNDSRRTPDERRLGEDVREWYELVWDRTGVRPPRAAA